MLQKEIKYNSRCKSCGGKITLDTAPNKTQYGLIEYFLFGWSYLIFKSEFRQNKRKCDHCGHEVKSKNAWAWVCIIIIASLILLFILYQGK